MLQLLLSQRWLVMLLRFVIFLHVGSYLCLTMSFDCIFWLIMQCICFPFCLQQVNADCCYNQKIAKEILSHACVHVKE